MNLEQAKEVGGLLRRAKRVLIITGAGISAESGIPTFRGATAAYADGRTEEGLPFEEVLSHTMFLRNPELTWKYLFLLEAAIRGKQPNAGHRAIAAMQTSRRAVCVTTQNIDGLHQMAGSKYVVELHGNMFHMICTGCEYEKRHETFEGLPKLPRCPECKEVLRPDIVLYEEMLPEAALAALEMEQMKGIDILFSVGTTSLFPYVTRPVVLASHMGVPVVEVNPEETPVSEFADFRLRTTAGEAFSGIMRELEV